MAARQRGLAAKQWLEDLGRQGCSWQARRWLVDVVRWQILDWVFPHSCADKLGGTTGERDRPHNPGFQGGVNQVAELWC